MNKYYVDRVDGRDNSNEKYIVIRVDLGAKLVHKNRKIIDKFIKMLLCNNGKAASEIKLFMDELKNNEIKCPSCKGEGEFEQSAGSHSFFVDCDKCNGKGLVRKQN